jgi:hypothetical protein
MGWMRQIKVRVAMSRLGVVLKEITGIEIDIFDIRRAGVEMKFRCQQLKSRDR